MIRVKSDELTEKQLAEIAVAIQNRWDLPTFVKMHEIVVDDAFDEDSRHIEIPIDSERFESGMRQIIDNLEMTSAFQFEKIGKTKYRLKMVDQSQIPTWMRGSDRVTPEGVLACPHCGKWFRNDFELNLHTKLHYIL